MAADNQTTIAGNLVDTPELRFTNNGTPVTNLRVAVTQRIQQDGEWRDGDTSFFKVNVWRGQAEHLADSLSRDPPCRFLPRGFQRVGGVDCAWRRAGGYPPLVFGGPGRRSGHRWALGPSGRQAAADPGRAGWGGDRGRWWSGGERHAA
jgi:hypothetical protein